MSVRGAFMAFLLVVGAMGLVMAAAISWMTFCWAVVFLAAIVHAEIGLLWPQAQSSAGYRVTAMILRLIFAPIVLAWVAVLCANLVAFALPGWFAMPAPLRMSHDEVRDLQVLLAIGAAFSLAENVYRRLTPAPRQQQRPPLNFSA